MAKKAKRGFESTDLTQTSVIYCGDNLDKLRTLPDESVDLIYIDPPFNSNRNYEVFWGETKEKQRSAKELKLRRFPITPLQIGQE